MSSDMTLLMLILLLPVVAALLPRRWAFFGYGCVLLTAGLFWLEMHVQPFGQSNDRGFGVLLLGAWLVLTGIGLGSVLVRPVVARLLSIKSKPGVAEVALWPLPLGVLIGVFFMHWLSNRMAGATPALLAHLCVALGGLGAALVIWRLRPRDQGLLGVSHGLIAVCLTIFAWVSVSAYEAQRWASLATLEAGGAPYCLLTFAGRDRPRAAREVLELSRLLSRSGGRSFSDDAHWLVEGPAGLEAWRSSRMGEAEPFLDPRDIVGVPACTPHAGGGLENAAPGKDGKAAAESRASLAL